MSEVSNVRPEFSHVKLNGLGQRRATEVAEAYTELLEFVERIGTNGGGREVALARTALQEACFWTKKALCMDPANRE